MQATFSSTLLLTILLAIGLVFFLRAASKDRTTTIDVHSSKPPLEVLDGITHWLLDRGWKNNGGDSDKQILRFQGNVNSSRLLAVFLSVLGGLGAGCLGLVIIQLHPSFGWWPLLLSCLGGPLAGIIYRQRASRIEALEMRLMNSPERIGSVLRIRAHRDELIALENELSKNLDLSSDGSLLSSPI